MSSGLGARIFVRYGSLNAIFAKIAQARLKVDPVIIDIALSLDIERKIFVFTKNVYYHFILSIHDNNKVSSIRAQQW